MSACEVWPGIWVGDLSAAMFWPGPKLAVRDQPADYLFRSQHDRQVHFVYGRMTPEVAEPAASWLDDMKHRGLPCLVHCSGGIHRSAAVVVYWLITRGHFRSVEAAYEYVRARRPEIEPRPNWLPLNGNSRRP